MSKVKLNKRIIRALLFAVVSPIVVPIALPVLYVIKIKDILKGK